MNNLVSLIFGIVLGHLGMRFYVKNGHSYEIYLYIALFILYVIRINI